MFNGSLKTPFKKNKHHKKQGQPECMTCDLIGWLLLPLWRLAAVMI